MYMYSRTHNHTYTHTHTPTHTHTYTPTHTYLHTHTPTHTHTYTHTHTAHITELLRNIINNLYSDHYIIHILPEALRLCSLINHHHLHS